jgi:hypothetical protein
MMASKNVLFVSARCPHSRQLMHTVMQAGLRSAFVVVDVDQGRHKIPSNVHSVPAVMVPARRELHEGDAAFRYVQQLLGEGRRPQLAAEVQPCAVQDIGGCISDSYAVLDDAATPTAFGYQLLGDQQVIETPAEDVAKRHSSKSDLEALVKQRDSDMDKLFAARTPMRT